MKRVKTWGIALGWLATALVAGCSVFSPPPEARIERATPTTLESLGEDLRTRLADNPDNPELQYLLALTSLRLGKLEAAEAHALEAAVRWPFEPKLLEVLGRISLGQNRRFRALTYFNQAINLDPGLLPAYVNLAITHHLLEQGPQAVRALRNAVRREPLYYPAQYHLARILYETHSIAGAGKSLDQALEAVRTARLIRPDARDAVVLEIRIVKALGKLSLARFLVDEALKVEPDAPDLLRERIDVHYQRKEWEQALGLLHRLDLGGGLTPEDGLLLVRIQQARGEENAAAVVLADVLKNHPRHPGALLEQARQMVARNDPQGGLAALQEVVEQSPALPEGFYWKAVAHYQLGEVHQGNAALAVAERLAPLHPQVRLLRVRRLLAERLMTQAAELLEEYLEAYPADGDALLIQAELLTVRGNFDQAEAILDELIPSESENALRFARARLAYLRGEFRSVLEQTSAAYAAGPVPWRLAYLHAAALGRTGETGDALKIAEPFLKGREGGAAFFLLVGQLQATSGARKAAEETLLTGLSRLPRHTGLIEAISRLHVEDGKWAQARDWLLAGLERPGSREALFLERLSLVYLRLKEPDKSREMQQRYLAVTDPLLNERQHISEPGVLFGAMFPTIGYGILPPISTNPNATD